MKDPVITRLAAANPYPAPTASPAANAPRRFTPRVVLGAAVAAIAISVPLAAFASDISGLFDVSTQGQPVATSDTSFARVTALNAALRELDFPSTMQLLDEREGVSFYGARRRDGRFCFAVESGAGKAVGCDNGSPSGAVFPSAQRPIIDFSRFSDGARLVGFAADGVASVALFDASGMRIASAPVVNNVYADVNPPAGAAGVEALDAHGAVIYRRSFDHAP
jgi:hypothetical protein